LKIKKVTGFAVTFVMFAIPNLQSVFAQEPAKESKPPAAAAEAKPAPPAEPPKEESSVTDHTIRIAGQQIPYKATASTTLLKDDKGEPTALLYSTAYTRSDVKDLTQRPIAFIYNGGPGSASIWLHMGAFGPRRVVTNDGGTTPPAPYQIVDNAECLLDKSDLVFIDPVGTGFSHAVGKAQDKDFWGVDKDVKSLAQFINIYISRNNRWNSPKYLIGESYGTFRSAALGNYLQSHDGMYLNGMVLISNVLDFDTLVFNTGQDLPFIFYLPSYAATAWYHKVLKDQPSDFAAFVSDARKYAANEYALALMKGAKISDTEKAEVAKKLSYFTGLSEDYLVKADLRVNLAQFMAELQRNRRLTTGRLDARYTGPTYDLLTENAENDPQDLAISGPFIAAFNSYVREELKFGQDKLYKPGAPDAGKDWDWKHNNGNVNGDPVAPNVEGDLINALITNPRLQVQVENGYYDLATPFFATEYTMEHLFLPPALSGQIHLEYYTAGHMMYLHEEDRSKLKSNVGSFIDSTYKR
jgi:carboxypeptidase C (cathepsin A)